MTKAEMTTLIAQRCGVSRELGAEALHDLFATLAARLADGETVRIHDFGSLDAQPVPQRQGRNPRTGATITIAAGCRIKFRPARALKTYVEGAVRAAARQAAAE